MALALLHLAAARRRLRRRRLPRRRPALRFPGGRRRPDRAHARARPPGAGRHRAEPLLERAPVVPGGPRRRTGEPGPGSLHLPRRQGRAGRAATEQLGEHVRRAGVDAGHGARRNGGAVVSPPLRRDPARLRLDQPRGRRRDGVGAALLARPRRRRLPDRRRPWPGQGRGTARRSGRPRRGAAHRRAADVGPAGRPRHLPSLAKGHRLLLGRGRGRRPHPGRRGVGASRRVARQVRPR